MRKRKSVLLAINTLTSIPSEVASDWMLLAYRLGRNYPKTIDFSIMVTRRMAIDRFRNLAARICVQNSYDYVFFVDDDMRLGMDPVSIFDKLLKANYDIIGANVYVRGYPFKPMGYKNVSYGEGITKMDNIDEADYKDVDSQGVLKVEAIGTAVSLIRGTVFHKVEEPWFLTGPHNTEDIYFCCKAADTYKKRRMKLKIGFHTGAVCGHMLDPENISEFTKPKLMTYYESFMSEEQVALYKGIKEDHNSDYVKNNIDLEESKDAENT